MDLGGKLCATVAALLVAAWFADEIDEKVAGAFRHSGLVLGAALYLFIVGAIWL